MFTVRVDGDPTRWSPGEDLYDLKSRFGVLIKYPQELHLTEKTCNLNAATMLEQNL